MNLDNHRVDADTEVRLGLAKPAWFMLVDRDKPAFNLRKLHRIVLGHCKRATVAMEGTGLSFSFTGASEAGTAHMAKRLQYLGSTPFSMGLVIERVAGKTALVALFVTLEAFDDAVTAFAEMGEDEEEEAEEAPAYMMRDRDTGEEYICLDPPGGTFRDMGTEYIRNEQSGIKNRDRRNGYWKNGDCQFFQPEGAVREVLLEVASRNDPLIIKVPRLDRTAVFPDGYEVIEEDSLEGWRVWQWCVKNATSEWLWVNLGADGGPWLELRSITDLKDLLIAFPELVERNRDLGS